MRNASYQGRRNNNNNRHRNRNNSGPARPHRNQVLDSNGPEGRVRGTAFQINEKYEGFAKDAAGRNDSILAENYLQHAEHYQRMINEFEEQNPQPQKRPHHNHNDDDDSHNDDDAHNSESQAKDNDNEDQPQKRNFKKPAPKLRDDNSDDEDLGLPTSIVAEPKTVKKVAVRKTTRVAVNKEAS